MSLLNVINISHCYGSRDILTNVSFRLLRGEHVALIGSNGEGKSTFMNIITGQLEPDEGIIEKSNKLKIGYLDQKIVMNKNKNIFSYLKEAFKEQYDLESEMNSLYDDMIDAKEEQLINLIQRSSEIQSYLECNGFYSLEKNIYEVAYGLGIYSYGMEKEIYELSGGERTKVALAKLLLEKPDLLLLDEPTNYLDKEHVEWLTKYLNGYENAYIVISHDVEFLNLVTDIVYHVEDGQLNRYVGNYNDFLKKYSEEKKKVEIAYKKQKKEIERMEDFISRSKANLATSNMAKSRQKKLDKIERIVIKAEKPSPKFNFIFSRSPSKIIFETKNLVIGYDKAISRELNLSMERGMKIGLIGSNGAGKSTFIKCILRKIAPFAGNFQLGDRLDIGYFEQEDRKNNRKTCIEEIWDEFPGCNQREIRQMIARCGLSKDQMESQIRTLSGGETSKIRLCKILNRQNNVLFLDEPTTHLDKEAKDELKMALRKYRGSMILVSHDYKFYMDVVDEIWNCEKWINS